MGACEWKRAILVSDLVSSQCQPHKARLSGIRDEGNG